MLNFCIYFFVLIKLTHQSLLQGFDDSILYSINWVGASNDLVGSQEQEERINFEDIIVQTEEQEKYKCRIPQVTDKEKDANEKYSGPSAFHLLSELFAHSSCSYRLESFWTYELCHGRFIRQYHEEREGKAVKLQEYYLGRWDKLEQERLRESMEAEDSDRPGHTVPVKKIDGLNMPFFQMNMTDGTLCDLNGKPRLTNVLYVCYALGKHDIYSLKETSICEYEIIVLSPLLCSHPKYRPQTSGENAINCSPLGTAGRMPKSLLQLEAESVKLQHQNFADELLDTLMAIMSFEASGKNALPRVRLERMPLSEARTAEDTNRQTSAASNPKEQLKSVDATAYSNFIAGTDCIQGGTGWWKYEFCYGKRVSQYHIDKDGSSILDLGTFIKSGHLKWLKANPHKRPVVGSHVSYLYTMGSVCDETGLPRQTEVKLKCVKTRMSPGSVTVYLLEPRTCEYILGVESWLICRLLEDIDSDGLLTGENSVGFTRSEYSSGYTRPSKPIEARGPDTKEKKEIKVTIILPEEGNHIADGDE